MDLLPCNILLITPGRIASSEIMATALAELATTGSIAYACLHDNESTYAERAEKAAWADVVFIFRSCDPPTLRLLEYARTAGKAIVYGTDDDFRDLDPQSPLGQAFHSSGNAIVFERIIREADVIWVFTEEMRQRLTAYNHNIVVGRLPSPVEFFLSAGNGEDWAEKDSYSDVITIGYAGSSTHQRDLEVVIRPLQRVLDENGPTVRLETINWMPKELADHPQVTCLPYISSLKKYYEHLARANWSIGLAPLEDTAFNRGKTNNKYREYIALGIPGIYSDMPVYSSCVQHCRTGYLTKHTEDAVLEALRAMIFNSTLRKQIRLGGLQEAWSRYSPRAMQLQILKELSMLALRKSAPKRKSNKPHILIVGYAHVSTTHIAALQPARRLRESNLLEFEFREPGHLSDQDVRKADCVLVVRAAAPETTSVIDWAQRFRVPLVFCWDDDFFCLPMDTSLGQYYRQANVIYALQRFLRESNIVLVSTPPLSARSRAYNRNVWEASYGFFEPEHANFNQEGSLVKGDAGVIRVGYFGSNEGLNLPFVVQALERIKAKYGRNVILESIGSRPSPQLKQLLDWHWDRPLSIDESLCLLRSRNWHVGLAPLPGSEFFAAKQATKFRDYAWCGAAMIASKVPTYQRVLLNRVHALLAENTADAWEQAITNLIEDEPRRHFLLAGARALLHHAHMGDALLAHWYQLLWRLGQAHEMPQHPRDHLNDGQLAGEARRGALLDGPARLPQGYARIGSGISYKIAPRHNNWHGLEVLSVARPHAVSGMLALRICNSRGQQMREAVVDVCLAREDEWLRFNFPPITNSAGKVFTLSFTVTDSQPGDVIVLHESSALEPRYRRALRRLGLPLSGNELYCRLWHTT